MPLTVDEFLFPSRNIPSTAWDLRAKCNYLEAFALARDARHPDWMSATVACIRPELHRLRQKPAVRNTDAVQRALRNGWNTELLLSLPLETPSLIQSANHWAAIQAYYAVQAVSLAWFACGGEAPSKHAVQLKTIGDTFQTRQYVPYPLNVVSTSLHPMVVIERHRNLTKTEGLVVSRRPSPASAEGYLFSALQATRTAADEERRIKWMSSNKGRIHRSSALVKEHDRQIGTMTFIDLLWQMRLQANYHDSEPFTSDGISIDDPRRFLHSLTTLVSTANLLFELLTAARVGPKVLHTVLGGVTGPHADAKLGPFERQAHWDAMS